MYTGIVSHWGACWLAHGAQSRTWRTVQRRLVRQLCADSPEQAMLLGLQTWRCWGASTSLVSTKGQRSGVGGKTWKALHKPPIIRVKGSRVLIATIDPAPPLTPLRQLRHLREPVWLIEELGFSSSVWPWVGEVGWGEKRAKHTSQYYNGLWPSKAQAYPPRFYCLIFNFSHEGEFKFNLIFSSWRVIMKKYWETLVWAHTLQSEEHSLVGVPSKRRYLGCVLREGYEEALHC